LRKHQLKDLQAVRPSSNQPLKNQQDMKTSTLLSTNHLQFLSSPTTRRLPDTFLSQAHLQTLNTSSTINLPELTKSINQLQFNGLLTMKPPLFLFTIMKKTPMNSPQLKSHLHTSHITTKSHQPRLISLMSQPQLSGPATTMLPLNNSTLMM
jgi:hypothetical protein